MARIWRGGLDDDTLSGDDGMDRLYGGKGNDILRGGLGDGDFLSGGQGEDIYLFGLGDGNTVIRTRDQIPGRDDTLRFLVGISANDIVFSRDRKALLLTLQSTGEEIRIRGFYRGEDFELKAIEFADGTLWDATTIQTRAGAVR
jgi:Ca2+-binding RTX toxin-like protein